MRTGWKILGTAFGLSLFAAALHLFFSVRDRGGTVSVFLQGEALTRQEAQEICDSEAGQEEPLSVCFFGEKRTTVICPENGNAREAYLVLSSGNAALLEPEGSLLNWREDGCLLDRESAGNLFGTGNARGQQIQIDGKLWTVIGTFDAEEAYVIRQAEDADGALLNQAVLLPPDTGDQKTKAEQFLIRHTLSGDILCLENLCIFAGDLLLAGPLLLCIFLVRALFSENRRGLQKRRGNAWLCFLTAACMAAVLWIAGNCFKIPADMIPTRWSDFSFWPKWWSQQKDNLLVILQRAQGGGQITVVWKLLSSAACSLGLVLFVTAAFAFGRMDRSS